MICFRAAHSPLVTGMPTTHNFGDLRPQLCILLYCRDPEGEMTTGATFYRSMGAITAQHLGWWCGQRSKLSG